MDDTLVATIADLTKQNQDLLKRVTALETVLVNLLPDLNPENAEDFISKNKQQLLEYLSYSIPHTITANIYVDPYNHSSTLTINSCVGKIMATSVVGLPNYTLTAST